MRAVVCRVDDAHVIADGVETGRIARGLLVYLGVIAGDTDAHALWLADKLASLRLFNDDHGKINLAVADVAGSILLIPNFTLAGRTSKGTRPSFSEAAPPHLASALFDRLAELLRQRLPVATGVFGAHMVIHATFHGPVTVVVDTPANP